MSNAERKNGDQDADVAFGIVACLIVFFTVISLASSEHHVGFISAVDRN